MQRSKNSSSLVGNHDRPPHVFLTELAGWSDQSSSNWRAQANPGRTTPLNAQERGFWVLLTKILRAWRLASLFFVGASYHFWAKKSWNRKSIEIETYKSRTIRQWKWCQAKFSLWSRWPMFSVCSKEEACVPCYMALRKWHFFYCSCK